MLKKLAISYYDILGVAPQASQTHIREAYKNLALKYHPDKNPKAKQLATMRFKAINEAYDTLKSKEKRHIYNMHLAKKKGIKALKAKRKPMNDNKRNSWLSSVIRFFSDTSTTG